MTDPNLDLELFDLLVRRHPDLADLLQDMARERRQSLYDLAAEMMATQMNMEFEAGQWKAR